MKVTIYWTHEGLKIRDKICEFFNIPMRLTINGETSCEIDDNMINKLKAYRDWETTPIIVTGKQHLLS